MPNTLYSTAKQAFLTSIEIDNVQTNIDWVNDNFGAALVSSIYTIDAIADSHLSDIPSSAILSRTSLTTSAIGSGSGLGTAYAESVTFTDFPGVSTGTQGDYIVIYRDAGTGQDSDNLLISYIDTADGLPVIYNTGDIQVNWDNTNTGTSVGRVFRL